jgi:predicted small secreted protein
MYMKLDKGVFERWVTWADRIKKDLQGLVNNQQIFLRFNDIVQRNLEHIKQNEGLLFCYFVANCYAGQAAVGIRRHLKIDDNSISLRKLMEQIKKCASQFTFEFYIAQYPINGSYINWQKPTFSQFSHDEKVIAEDIIDADLKTLDILGRQIETYVDRQLAHLDKRGWDGRVKSGDMKKMIDQFDALACKYLSLIAAKGYTSLSPTICYDWDRIFQVPLNVQDQLCG